MNPLVEFLAGGGGLGYRQRKQKEDQEAEMARLFKEQQMKTMALQQQQAEFQLKQAQQPQTQRIERNGQIWEIDVDSSGKSIGQPRLLGADSPPTAPSVVGAGGGMPGIPVPPMRPTGATPGTFPGPTSRGTPGFNPNPTSGSPSFNAPPQWNPKGNEVEIMGVLTPEEREAVYNAPNPRERSRLLTIGANKLREQKKEDAKDPSGMRGEFRTVTKEFSTVDDAWGRIIASAEDPSAAGDLALIFNYMKVLDPGSTVREGEFATAQNSAKVPDIIRAKYNQVTKGERLAPAQRNDFVNRAQKLYGNALEKYDKTVSEFQRLAELSGYNPEMVIFDRAAGRDYKLPEMPVDEPPPADIGDDLSVEDRQELLAILQELPPEVRQAILSRYMQ